MNSGANRLPILAAEIRQTHADVQEAAKTAAQRALDAGHALVEAKALVRHSEWLPWLRENCALAERTAQLYMKIAKSGLKSAHVADLTLKMAAQIEWVIEDDNYNPFSHCSASDRRDWYLFMHFLVTRWGFSQEGAGGHTEWVLQKEFRTPDDWLSEEGARFRRICRMGAVSAEFIAEWDRFKADNNDLTIEDIERSAREAGR